MKKIPFGNHFGTLVDIKYSNCKSNRLKRQIRNIGFDRLETYIGDINYVFEHKLNHSLLGQLAICE